MSIELGSTREDINGIFQELIKDEKLLRLLTYYPQDANNLDPLDKRLSNIVDVESDEYWEIVADRIRLAEKTSDLILKPKCIIYIGLGRRRPVFGNHILVTQEINISIYTHQDFEADMRHVWILDRINELIVMKEISGLTRLDYIAGNPRVAPVHYIRYDHIFGYVTGKR